MNPRPGEDVYPLAILTKNRRILFVGGGKVAAAKLPRLAGHSWTLVVVAKELKPEIVDLCDVKGIEIRRRAYCPQDLDGIDLAFAATDDAGLNRRILSEARERGVLSCAADANWRQGDFISPAIISGRRGTAAFSSGGISCRTTRLVKQSLSRQLEATERWSPMVVGTSHHQLDLDSRALLHREGEGLLELGGRVEELRGVHEFVLLSTCNRLELYCLATDRETTLDVLKTVMGLSALDADQYYIHRGFEALAHGARVGAGILSQTPGENHIVSQLKCAMQEAADEGWAGPFMKDWFAKSLHISKHIRKSTGEILKSSELEDLVVGYLEQCGAIAGRRILVLGSGMVGGEMAAVLTRRRIPFTWAFHRNRPESSRLTEAVRIDELGTQPQNSGFDVLIAAVSREKAYLPDELPGVLGSAGTAIDLGVPRNLDPVWGETYRLVDMEDLKHWYRRNLADMEMVFSVADREIKEHRADYEKLVESL